MCGIAGILRKEQQITSDEINAITDAIRSRGPDERGIWIDGNKALGHRRLSIIDLEGGHQPMFTNDNMLGIVFNGEIYNYHELKKILEHKGYQFKTSSDTEVLLYSYMEWKEKCLDRLRGMFAFAIIDKPKEIFFIARDHMGIKPLVYYHSDKLFAFSSEIRSLKKVKSTTFTIDVTALDEYLWLQYIPAPKTIYQEVKKLNPAHYMVVSFSGEIVEIQKYWDICFKENSTKSEAQWIDELDSVLKDSVNSHLISDVPFGAFLSGGIDSSLVVNYMSEILGYTFDTFSIGFEEQEYNELKYARVVSDRFKTTHHEQIILPDALAILPELVSHYGEPFGDSSAVPTYYVSKLARKHVPMVLSGDGADEIFAGYESYKCWMKYLSDGDKYPKWKKIIRPSLETLFPKKYPKIQKYGDKLDNWLSFVSYIPYQSRRNLWKKDFYSAMTEKIDLYESLFDKASQLNPLNKAQYMDIKTYLPFDILTKVDIASMMHGLEVRTPFVDKNVYEFAATIPSALNFSKINNNQTNGKLILKKILEKNMSRDFVYREKMGFAMPINKWFKNTRFFQENLNDRLLNPSGMLSEYFEQNEIKNIISSNHFGPIWLLFFLEEWLVQEKNNL